LDDNPNDEPNDDSSHIGIGPLIDRIKLMSFDVVSQLELAWVMTGVHRDSSHHRVRTEKRSAKNHTLVKEFVSQNTASNGTES
jgi:hypothetical protein